jgi:hypothetical protein
LDELILLLKDVKTLAEVELRLRPLKSDDDDPPLDDVVHAVPRQGRNPPAGIDS